MRGYDLGPQIVELADRVRPLHAARAACPADRRDQYRRTRICQLNTLSVVLSDASILFILSAGMTFVIMLGGIDLSVQAAASFASMVVAELLPRVSYAAFRITLLWA